MHQNLGLTLSAFRPIINPSAPHYAPRGQWLGLIPGAYLTSYSHTISAFLGFDSCSFGVAGNIEAIQAWIIGGLGRHIVAKDQDAVVVWDGFSNEWSASMGSLSTSGGPLMDVVNRGTVTYTQTDPTASPPATGFQTETPIAEEEDSQIRFGVIEEVISGGRATSQGAQELRDAIMVDKSEPQTSEDLTVGTGGNTAKVNVKCLGYWAYLGQQVYNDLTGTLTTTAGDKIVDILQADPNGLFYRGAYPFVDDPGILVPSFGRDNAMALDLIKAIVARGGGPPDYERWLFGVYAGVTPKYQPIPTDVTYQHRVMGTGQRIEKFGTADIVYPWQVRAGKWMFLPDYLAGRISDQTDKRKDPRYIFIESVTYTAPWTVKITGKRAGKIEQMLAEYGLGGMS